jgi:hypothetical protein
MRCVLSFILAGFLSGFQFLLTPYLTYSGRGVKEALLPREATVWLCPLMFLAVLVASFRSPIDDTVKAFRRCCYRSALWSGILTIFFFELVCCGLWRFDQVPPSGDLHWGAAAIFFCMVWSGSLGVVLVEYHLRSKLRLPRS